MLYRINQCCFFTTKCFLLILICLPQKAKVMLGRCNFPRIAWVIISQPGLRGYLLLWWIILVRDGLKWVSSPVGSAIHELLAVVGKPYRTMRREGDSLNVFICNLNPTSSCCYTCPALLFSHCWLCVCVFEKEPNTLKSILCVRSWVSEGCVCCGGCPEGYVPWGRLLPTSVPAATVS